ncbi:TldD/PmbA family protein [Synechocystis sp. LKSZ1]|uniref:TldD/PmbA family protein n=1 Tax=Synechocystis sp. LKSZ1 TaxID=3144951 RepID=UPI00336BC7F8
MSADLETLLDLALKAGADAAEVYQASSLSHPVFFEANRLKQLETVESEGLALRLWREGRPGLAVAYGPIDPQRLVGKALELAALNDPEEPALAPPRRNWHSSLGESVSVENLIDIGKATIAALRSAYPEVICGGELSCETEKTRLLNSQGLDCQIEETSVSYYFGVEWIRGEDFLAVYDGDYGRGAFTTDEVIAQLLQRLHWAKALAPSPTGKLPVLFTSNAASLLWDTVAAALNGKRVLEGSSPWSERQGQGVVSPLISLAQDPNLSPYDCPFDDEGTPTQAYSLIQRGQLQQFYSDRMTARRLGQLPSGNGFRPGLEYYPVPSLVNLVVAPGQEDGQSLLQALPQALIVAQILGDGADLSGDFSVNVDLGYAVADGEVLGRVKDTMIAGNVYQLLNQVIAVGNDRRWQGSYYTPSLLIDGVAIVA